MLRTEPTVDDDTNEIMAPKMCPLAPSSLESFGNFFHIKHAFILVD